MVTAQWSGTGGIEMRVGDDQFLALVSTAVVPYDGSTEYRMAKPGAWASPLLHFTAKNGIYENNLCHLFANADIIL